MRRSLAVLVALLLPVALQAQGDTATFMIANFHFADGESLAVLKLHYLTLGHPRRNAAGHVSNAVLVLHGTGGTGRQFLNPLFTELYGPGEALDTTTHYIILPDDIGHGRSSKPSDGLRQRFPHYAYTDLVTAEYRLVTEGLHVDHLLVVMGTSMGCMHSWMWAERYPDFMDGAVPLACLPAQIAGRNRMLRRMAMDAIRTDSAWHDGEYTSQPPGLRGALEVLFFMGSSPRRLQQAFPTRDSADADITRWMDRELAITDANDFLYQFDASRDYDPSRDLGRIKAQVLAINSADDEVNPPSLDVMTTLFPKVRHGRYVLLPISDLTRGHGTHTVAAAWKQYFARFVASLEPLSK
ncbi:MAG TPA: alpha/beta fold hydrolase [Gemmatimonadales bacterium]|nr:alpha/beta fold hydrolase [Gemmatimonadales bacterium]